MTQKTLEKTLFERIGGEEAVSAAVDIFYRKVLADETLAPFFETTDMVEQHKKQKAFLTFAFGGPNNYSGKDMREAHKGLVDRGMNETHFNSVAGHLQDTLSELNVPSQVAGEVMAIAGSTKSDVLNQ